MSKLTNVARQAIADLYGIGAKPTSWDYRTMIDAIQDGIESHEHRIGGGPGTGTGDASTENYAQAVLDINLHNIHAWMRLLATRPDLAANIPVQTWQNT